MNETVVSGRCRDPVDEDDLMPLSGLQHLVFCERQFALIHIERVWVENRLTLEGSHLHDRTHDAGPRREMRGDVVVTRGLPLQSRRLGVAGKADVVEFRRQPDRPPGAHVGIELEGLSGRWIPFPVEYKRGRPKPGGADEVQLCAQAMCLEEMLNVTVPRGALFYGRTRRRLEVSFTSALRQSTVDTAARLHALVREGVTPRIRQMPKCKRCSLLEVCRPKVTGATSSCASRYMVGAVRGASPEGTER